MEKKVEAYSIWACNGAYCLVCGPSRHWGKHLGEDTFNHSRHSREGKTPKGVATVRATKLKKGCPSFTGVLQKKNKYSSTELRRHSEKSRRFAEFCTGEERGPRKEGWGPKWGNTDDRRKGLVWATSLERDNREKKGEAVQKGQNSERYGRGTRSENFWEGCWIGDSTGGKSPGNMSGPEKNVTKKEGDDWPSCGFTKHSSWDR